MSEIHETESTIETDAPEVKTEPVESRELDSELDDNYDAYLQDEERNGPDGARDGDLSPEVERDEPEGQPETGKDQPENEPETETDQPEKKSAPVETDEAEGADAPTRLKCRNEELAGSEHPETGVPFVQKQVDVEGRTYEVVAPEFKSEYDAQLPKDMYEATDRKQFKECNSQLSKAVADDPDLRSRFTGDGLEQIENGDTPDGYTWHHDVEEGKMQLVDTGTHQKTGHTGGRSLWGGGTESR